MARNKHKVFSDFQPEAPIELPVPRIEDEQWSSLAETLMNLIDINLSNRESLDSELDRGNASYEMRGNQAENDIPYPGAPNMIVPFVATAVEEFASRISGTAILPRPFTVRGNNPEASAYAHTVEQFYNGEFLAHNWEEAMRTCIHLAARDGTSVMATTWKMKVVERVVLADAPQLDGTIKKERQRIKMVQYDAPYLEAVELRDFLLMPAWAISAEQGEADAVAWKRYLGENALDEMVNSGVLDEEQVEAALSYVNTGSGDLSLDRQGNDTYTINNLIDVTDSSVGAPSGIKMTRGPLEIWQIHSDQFDLDGDGVPEENIFWVHDRSRILLGYAPFEYMAGRPFHPYSPFPRPNRFYGFSIPLRLIGLQEEANVQHWGRLELLDWVLNPTVVKSRGLRLDSEDQKIGKNSILSMPDGMNASQALSFMGPPEVPQASIQEEQLLDQWAQRVVGAPQTPGAPNNQMNSGGGGRQSARAAQSMAAVQGLQTNMIISRTRAWMLSIFKYIHILYKQYGKDQLESVDASQDGAKKVIIPKETLALDYTLSIAGSGGPLDKESRRNDVMQMFQTLMPLPIVQSDMTRIWALCQMFLETFDVSEVTRIIGTMDEAKQLQQAQAQAAQAEKQHELQMQAISHAKVQGDGQQPQQGPQ